MTKFDLFQDENKSGSPHSEEVEFKVMEISPLTAREWLDATDMTIQRKINPANVSYLSSEISKGNWRLNGEPIIIDADGNIIDGIHRLSAIIESGETIKSAVVFGVQKNSIHTIDQGRARSLADVFTIQFQPKYAATSAAAVNVIFQFRARRYSRVGFGALNGSAGGGGIQRDQKASPAEAKKFISQNPGFFSFVEESMRLYHNGDKLLAARTFCGMKWIIEQENPIHSESFFTALSTGVGISEDNPIYYLRKKLIENKNPNSRVRPMSGLQLTALLIKTFNYFSEGVKIGTKIVMPKEMPEINKA